MLFNKSLESVVYGDPYLTETEIALMLLKAILEQKDPKLQTMLVEKLGTGPSGILVADCITRLAQLGLTVQAPETDQTEPPQESNQGFVHQAHRTLQKRF